MTTPPSRNLPLTTAAPDVVCFSHLRWDFVFQRPQHLLSRCARAHRVFFVEESIDADGPARLEVTVRQHGVRVVVPRLPQGLAPPAAALVQEQLLRRLFSDEHVRDYVLWYYTPMAIAFTRQLRPRVTVYDCMDELSAFAGAPAEMTERENELFDRADLVFTGGQALFEAKRHRHPSVHAFPSSVDISHFSRARLPQRDPDDQALVLRPRLGFYGVIDERLDVGLIGGLAALRPAWQIVLVGPVVKIDPAMLPRAANIHYLGPKPYDQLPAYLAGWDVAMLPFARNDATRYISPTKTPEYLAAGKPVVSTSIRDVVRTYGMRGLARIADTPDEFAAAVEAALAENPAERRRAADAFLTQTSWDGTWARMYQLISSVMTASAARRVGGPAFTEPGVA